jgi:hypothetical protein
VDLPGRDLVRDFLAQDGDGFKVYESENADTVVDDQRASVRIQQEESVLTVSGVAGDPFFYAKFSDPYVGKKVLKRVIRSDGKQIHESNAWLSRSFDREALRWDYFVNLFDNLNPSGKTYRMEFENAAPINHSPVLASVGDQIIRPDEDLLIAVQATDQDGDSLSVGATPLPVGMSFADLGQGRGELRWKPTNLQVGNYSIQISAADSLSSITKTVRVSVSGEASKLLVWKEQHWSGLSDPLVIGNDADPDEDGLRNVVEYGLNSDPTQPGVEGLPELGTEFVDGLTYLTLTYIRRTDDPRLRFDVISSNSLKAADDAWGLEAMAVPVDQAGVGAGMERVKVRDHLAIEGANPRRFLKLRVRLLDEALTSL